MSSSGGGKSSDDIVFELADSILGKVMEKLDLENGKADMFEVCRSRNFKITYTASDGPYNIKHFHMNINLIHIEYSVIHSTDFKEFRWTSIEFNHIYNDTFLISAG